MKNKILVLIVVFSTFIVSCQTNYPSLTNGLYADIQTNKGNILLKLHHQDVPMTVANFVGLAEGNHPKLSDSIKGKPFYNGVKFHRVIPNFMIQSGDPTGTGRGNAGYRFDDEITLDEDGKVKHKHDKAGVLSMANSGPATNSSQFFITHKPTSWLDGKHTVFGFVEVGQNVVDSIQKDDRIQKVVIIRVGKEAKSFDAPKVFELELANSVKRKEKKEKIMLEAKERFQKKMGIEKASKTDSGLKVLQLKKGSGKKVNPNLPTTVHYTLFDALGNKIDSSVDRNMPFTFTLNKDGLIPGWKEGASLMHEGEKSRLFIPSYLAYGAMGRPPVIQPNSDLIFEIEILKVGK